MTGMAAVIAAHVPTIVISTFNSPESGNGRICRCGVRVEVLHSEMDDNDSDAQPYLDRKLATHVAEELSKAGYGNVQEALLTAADEMEQERATWCLDDTGRYWITRTLNELRERAS